MKVFHSAIQSISQNRLRSSMAGFGIAWGIFLLVIFLGIGNGVQDGVMKMFNSFAQKSLFVYGGQTSMAGDRLGENTQILFDGCIIDDIKARYGSVAFCSEEVSSPSSIASYCGETVAVMVKGISADYFNIKILEVNDGRSIGRLDDLNRRNVAVIGEEVKRILFGKQECLGRVIDVDGSLFKVIGILRSDNLFSMQERNSVYVPSSSFVDNFNSEAKISSFCMSLSANTDTEEIEKDLKGYLAWRYGFASNDERAIYVANIENQTSAFENLFHILEVLIWIVGVCLLLSGIVGVCNVMLIIVKERTNEIGIRKAIGATSTSIISMIITESVTITFIAGLFGLMLGSLAVILADRVIIPLLGSAIVDDLRINLPAVVAAFVILCLSGVFAGLLPALKASRISPVDAIRYENRG